MPPITVRSSRSRRAYLAEERLVGTWVVNQTRYSLLVLERHIAKVAEHLWFQPGNAPFDSLGILVLAVIVDLAKISMMMGLEIMIIVMGIMMIVMGIMMIKLLIMISVQYAAKKSCNVRRGGSAS